MMQICEDPNYISKTHQFCFQLVGYTWLLLPVTAFVIGIFGLVIEPNPVQVVFLLLVFALPLLFFEIAMLFCAVPIMFSGARDFEFNYAPAICRIVVLVVFFAPAIHFLVLGSSGFKQAVTPFAVDISQMQQYYFGDGAYHSVQLNSDTRVYLQFMAEKRESDTVSIVATVLGNATQSSLRMKYPVLAVFRYNNASGISLQDAAMNAFKLVSNMTGVNDPYSSNSVFSNTNTETAVFAPVMNDLKTKLNITTKHLFQVVPSDGKPLVIFIAFLAAGISWYCIGLLGLILSPIIGISIYKLVKAQRQQQQQQSHADGHQ